MHEGALTLLPTTLTGNELSAMSDACSTYAVIYTDEQTAPTDSPGPLGLGGRRAHRGRAV